MAVGARGMSRVFRCALVVMLLACAAPVSAAPVWVTGGFTSFSGVVGSDFQFDTLINGDVVCPDAGCGIGIGAANVVFGSPAGQVDFFTTDFGSPAIANQLVFTPAQPQDVVKGQEFLLGTLSYTNGIWFTDPEFGFSLTTHSDDPDLAGFELVDTVHLFITTNLPTNTPDFNADFVYLKNLTTLGSVRAYELADSPNGSNRVTVDVFGTINSLHLTRFANAQGGGFIDAGVNAEPTPAPAPVPEPATIALLAAGLASMARLQRSVGRGVGRATA
jgi:hypothetical protein